ncbi:MAG: hypothetical protein ACRC39_01705 [Enterobacter sp.]
MASNTSTIAYVGYQQDENIKGYFSNQTVFFIQAKITELLRSFYQPGIIVPQDKILNVMNAVYTNFRPSTGDIFTRYSIPSNENNNYIDKMINQVIQIITNDVQNNLINEQSNNRLDIKSTILGDFNKWGLRQYSTIKTREKKPNFLINMNY